MEKMVDGEALKPVRCGCGGNWAIVTGRHPVAKYIYWYVRCEDCGTRTDEYDTKEQAIEAWNRAMSVTRDMDEWCTDCKEYDSDKHCCPRWNKVIRKTVEEMQLSGKLAKVINRRYNGTALGIVGLADRSYGLCGNCQGEVSERYTYCPHCGARLEWE